MVKYPNDPGPDHQCHPGHHRPNKEMSLITTEVFLEGISLQTKYAYKCSESFLNNSMRYTDSAVGALTSKVQQLELATDGALTNHAASLSALDERGLETDAAVQIVHSGLKSLREMIGNRMTERDHCHLINRIYSMC